MKQRLALSSRLECSGATSTSQVQAGLLTQPPEAAGILGANHNAQLFFFFFVFSVETEFHHIGQAGLELLTSGVLPTLASQSAGITGSEPPHPANSLDF